jgi:hypothetical protein
MHFEFGFGNVVAMMAGQKKVHLLALSQSCFLFATITLLFSLLYFTLVSFRLMAFFAFLQK